MRKLRIPIRMVFYREEGDWVAHCLEFDLMGDGPTQADAIKQLTDAIGAQVTASLANNNPKNLFSPADAKYFEMFAAGKDVTDGELKLHIDSVEIDQAETREYSGADAEACYA